MKRIESGLTIAKKKKKTYRYRHKNSPTEPYKQHDIKQNTDMSVLFIVTEVIIKCLAHSWILFDMKKEIKK